MNSSSHRPVVLSAADRQRLAAIATALERKRFMQDAELLRDIAARWDQSEGFVVLHQAAVSVRPEPEGEPA